MAGSARPTTRPPNRPPNAWPAAGFTAIEAWLQPEPTRFETGEPLETFLRTVVLGGHVARLPEAERDAFVHGVASRLLEPVIDYVRLNIVATRA